MVKSSDAGLWFVEHLGSIDALLLNTSRYKSVLTFLLRLRPPAAMKLSMEGMGFKTRVAIAKPMLLRLNMDPNALSKTQRLIDSFSDDKGKELAATFARNGTLPPSTRAALLRLDKQKHMRSQTSCRHHG